MSNLDPEADEDLYDFQEWCESNITLPSHPSYSSSPPAGGPLVRAVISSLLATFDGYQTLDM